MVSSVLSIIFISCGLYNQAKAIDNFIQDFAPIGDAIITAVEEDVEEEDERSEEQLRLILTLPKEFTEHLLKALMSDSDLIAFEQILENMDAGRAGNFYKRRKMLKFLYPLLIGILFAKSIILPLVLKFLTALSSMSFVMSKVALVTSSLLTLKWLFSGPVITNDKTQQSSRLEIIHQLNGKHHLIKRPSGAASLYNAVGQIFRADDISLKEKSASRRKQKYIPFIGSTVSSSEIVMAGGAGSRPTAVHL